MSNNKLVLITGSTDGIGKKTALEIVNLGYHVIIHGRNQKSAEQTMDQIKKETKDDCISATFADLGSFNQIIEMTKNIKKQFKKLDVLVNNAGVYRPEKRLSQENIEETFAINYVAPFLLTNLLIDLLKKADSSRIVNVVSQVHSNRLNLNDLQFQNDYTGVKAYAQSKTCLIMFTYLLAEKLKKTTTTVNCLHPGIINTKLLKAAMSSIGAPVSAGAENLIYIATSHKLEKITGTYFDNNKPKLSKEITYNAEMQKKLWEKTEKLIGMKFINSSFSYV